VSTRSSGPKPPTKSSAKPTVKRLQRRATNRRALSGEPAVSKQHAITTLLFIASCSRRLQTGVNHGGPGARGRGHATLPGADDHSQVRIAPLGLRTIIGPSISGQGFVLCDVRTTVIPQLNGLIGRGLMTHEDLWSISRPSAAALPKPGPITPANVPNAFVITTDDASNTQQIPMSLR
jgi:hypothetical protein